MTRRHNDASKSSRTERRSARPSERPLAKKAAKKTAGKAAKKTAAKPARSAADDRATARKKERAAAVKDFEAAVEKVRAGDWADARKRLQAIVDDHPAQLDIHDRVDIYLRICSRAHEPDDVKLKTADDHYHLGIIRLNDGDLEAAATLLGKAVELDGDSDKAYYALAAVKALADDRGEALTHLRRAIELNGDNRIHAAHDSHLEILRDEAEFAELTHRPASG